MSTEQRPLLHESALVDPNAFVKLYGLDAHVVVGNGMNITLGQALEAEKMFCPAEEITRQDPAKRLGYLATILAKADSLKPEHQFLINSQE